MNYKRLKLKLGVFLAGHAVDMVTYCATKLTATCSPMFGQFLSLGKYWKLFSATLNLEVVKKFQANNYRLPHWKKTVLFVHIPGILGRMVYKAPRNSRNRPFATVGHVTCFSRTH